MALERRATRAPDRAVGEKLAVATIGSARRSKGVLVAARAAYLIGAKLTVNGDISDQLRRQVRAANPGVSFGGAYEPGEVSNRLRDIACTLALPTNVDLAPFSVMESLALGVPVIASAVGGLPELVDDGRNGLLVPPNSVDAVVVALERLQREPGLLRALTSAVYNVPSWNDYVDAVEAAYVGRLVGEAAIGDAVRVRWEGPPPVEARRIAERSDLLVHFTQNSTIGVAQLPGPAQVHVWQSVQAPTDLHVIGRYLLVHPDDSPCEPPGWSRFKEIGAHVLVGCDDVRRAYARNHWPPSALHLARKGTTRVSAEEIAQVIAMMRVSDARQGAS